MKCASWLSKCFAATSTTPASASENRVSISAESTGGRNLEKFCCFSYNELNTATRGFSSSNKVGEGAFGSVYKGYLGNGTSVAVKVLSVEVESMRGEMEFISEIAALSNIKHENLVSLQGCCVEGSKRFLVYDYMANNSLASTLFCGKQNGTKFDWETRRSISLGVAKGLAYLHEAVQPHIVHRDIKASNILLDENFIPKVSDFGLSRLLRDTMSHISTHVAGTLGYLAPEYAVSGRLTRKSDVYSFGVLLLEIISGRSAVAFDSERGEEYLVQKAWEHHVCSRLARLVDPALGVRYPVGEAVRFIKVGLLCVQEKAALRPSMPTAVEMLTNSEAVINDSQISQPGLIADLMEIKLGQNKSPRHSNLCKGSSFESTHSPTAPSVD